MPLPLPTVHPKLLDAVARYYPQRIVVERKTAGARDAFGSPQEAWEPMPGHPTIDGEPAIRARVVSNGPGTGAGGWSGTTRLPEGWVITEGATASLMGYYPDIVETDRMVFQGRVYYLDAVEHDAESVTTRLRTKKVS